MPVLGAATLELNADSAKLEQDLGRAVQQAATLGTAIGTVLGQALNIATDKLTNMISKAIETGDELNKLNQKTGMSVGSLSELRVAAELADVSMGTLKNSIAALYEKISQGGRVDGKTREAFEAIGLSVEKLQEMKPDEVFRRVTERLSQYEDGLNRAAIQTALLGRSGKELSPFINDLAKTTAIARELGFTMDKETAAAAERFKDNLTIGRLASEAMGQRIAQVLLPTLENLSGHLVDNARDTTRLDTAARAADTGLKLFATAGNVVATVFSIAGNAVGNLGATVALFAHGEFKNALTTLGQSVVDTGTKIGESVAQIQLTWEEGGSKIAAGAEATGKKLAAPALAAAEKIRHSRKEIDFEVQLLLKTMAFEDEDTIGAQKAANDYFRKIGEDLERNAEMIRRQINETNAIVTQAIFNRERGIGPAFDEDTTGLEKVKTKVKETDTFARDMGLTFTSAFEQAALGGKKLSDVLKGLARDVEAVVLRKSVTEPLGSAISGAISDSGIGKGIGDFFKDLFRANGGPVNAGSPYVVGERGPELFVPGASGAIVPNGAMAGGAQVVINQTNNIDSRSDISAVREAMVAAKDAAVREVAAACQAGGSYAAMVRGA